MAVKSWLPKTIQFVVFLIVAWYVGRSLALNWAQLRATSFEFHLELGWMALSLLLAWSTYGLQVVSWRVILSGWGQRLPLLSLATIWFVANLGRYVPGKVWSVTGMVVLATRRGVPAWAATASAVVIQGLGIGAAVVVVLVTMPASASPAWLAVAAGAAIATLAAFAWPWLIRQLQTRVPQLRELRVLPLRTLATSVVLTTASWLTYGASLWALSRGLGNPPTLPLGAACGIFALGYTLGLLALVAPGGLVVREGILFAMLKPYLGAGPAVVVSIASRLILTVTELVAAAPFYFSTLRESTRVSP